MAGDINSLNLLVFLVIEYFTHPFFIQFVIANLIGYIHSNFLRNVDLGILFFQLGSFV